MNNTQQNVLLDASIKSAYYKENKKVYDTILNAWESLKLSVFGENISINSNGVAITKFGDTAIIDEANYLITISSAIQKNVPSSFTKYIPINDPVILNPLQQNAYNKLKEWEQE